VRKTNEILHKFLCYSITVSPVHFLALSYQYGVHRPVPKFMVRAPNTHHNSSSFFHEFKANMRHWSTIYQYVVRDNEQANTASFNFSSTSEMT